MVLSTAPPPRLYNLLEPHQLVRAFAEHPPAGFESVAGAVPSFVAPFDVLTTVDPAVRRFIARLPLLRRWTTQRTLFIGTTVSEYAVFPDAIEPEELVAKLSRQYPLTIIKDIPTDSVLVGDESSSWSRRVVRACRRARFVLIDGQALAYVPIDFGSIDEFLSRMSHSRRKNIRRKLRSRSRLSIDEIALGAPAFDDDAFIDRLYAMYYAVYEQSDIHFDLLSRDFFAAVLRDSSIDGCFFAYREGDSLIAFNLCVFGSGMLIDKYIGFVYPKAREYDVYAVSWFHNLERALELRCRYYVAGWTDPQVKRQLGARFTSTQHAVYIRNPLLRTLLRMLKPLFESDARSRS